MKIRVGLLVGYNGCGYHGIQFNKELDTIEKAIVECLLEAEAISKRNAEDPKKIHIKSSSRTDKGVHAAFNLVSVKIETNITPDLVSRLRDLLCLKKIHLYNIIRLTKSTIPSKQAESRIYEYIVPTFFLRKGDFNLEAELLRERDASSEKRDARREYPESMINEVVGYTSSRDDVEAFGSILQKYPGTKDFHNFTKLNSDKGSKRYVKSITVSETYVNDGIEYINVTINGQSFLLHQIRKMIFFAVLLCRYSRNNISSKFNRAFSGENIHIPKSPSEYLLLDRPIFYRLRRGDGTTEEVKVDDDQREEYKRNAIYPQVHQRKNLVGFFASLDSVRFHRENIAFMD